MEGTRIIREEMKEIGRSRKWNGLAVAGKTLLWMDLILLAFVYNGVRAGSYFWLYWVLIEGILGVALLALGSRKAGILADRDARTDRGI
jgi:hypothetical protein